MKGMVSVGRFLARSRTIIQARPVATFATVSLASALILTGLLGVWGSQGPSIVASRGPDLENPGFIGTNSHIQRGAGLALGKSVATVDPGLLPASSVGFLVVDMHWLIVRATAGQANAVLGFLHSGRPVAFVQLGAEITDQQVEAFLTDAQPWPITLTAVGTRIHDPTTDNMTVYPLPGDRVQAYVQVARMTQISGGEFQLASSASLGELTQYQLDQADLAVRDVLLKALRDAGMLA